MAKDQTPSTAAVPGCTPAAGFPFGPRRGAFLNAAERKHLFPEAYQMEAMGITDFTLVTMTRWVRSNFGRSHSLHPFRQGHFLGSGTGAMVMTEAGLDGDSQFEAVRA